MSHWAVPSLSSESAEAIRHYRNGVASLVSGTTHARQLLTTAIAIDPDFALARVALTVALVADGRPYEAPAVIEAAMTRAERQHREVVHTALAGDVRHAADLRREHLLEFPGDVLIVWLPVLAPRLARHVDGLSA